MHAVPEEFVRKLRQWKARPHWLGAWLDLALDSNGKEIWNTFDLNQRWKREWGAERIRVWLDRAEDLGLMTRTADGRGWKVARLPDVSAPQADRGPHPSGRRPRVGQAASDDAPAGKTVRVPEEQAAPLPDDMLVSAIVDALMARIPALKALDRGDGYAPPGHASRPEAQSPFGVTELVSLDELEKRYLIHVLHAADGNKSRTAELLGIDPSTLYRKLNRWELA